MSRRSTERRQARQGKEASKWPQKQNPPVRGGSCRGRDLERIVKTVSGALAGIPSKAPTE